MVSTFLLQVPNANTKNIAHESDKVQQHKGEYQGKEAMSFHK